MVYDIYIYIYIYGYMILYYEISLIMLGKFKHDLTVLPKPGIMVFIGKSSPNDRTIQVSEIL